MNSYYIAFDCGTMGTKTALYGQDSSLIASAYRENPIQFPRPGWAELDVNAFLKAVREGIAQCLAESKVTPSEIRGITGSGIICGIVGIDKDWNAVTPFIPYLDNRAAAEAAQVRAKGQNPWLKESGNSTVDEFQPPLILRWLLAQPQYAGKFVKVVNNCPYVLGKLAGLKADQAFLDWGTLSGWLIGYDTKKKDWSPRQLEVLELDRDLLPEICAPWKVVGYLCPQEAELLGLPAGIPIAAGSGDVMQSMLGAGVTDPGSCVDIAGTAAIFAVSLKDPIEAVSQVPGYYYALGTLEDTAFYWTMIRAGGLSLRWFRDSVALRPGDGAFYGQIDQEAQSVPAGCGGTLFYPYLQGAGPDLPGASGAFLGLRGGADRKTLWRAILESIAFEYDRVIRFYRSKGMAVTSMVGTEGGSRSDLWCKIKCDLTGVPYRVLQRTEGGLMASAALAAHAVGNLPDLKGSLDQWIQVRRSWSPDGPAHQLYQSLEDLREQLLGSSMAQIFRDLSAWGEGR